MSIYMYVTESRVALPFQGKLDFINAPTALSY